MGPKSLYLTPLLCLTELTPPVDGFPWDDFRKILRGCQWMAKVPNAVEKLPKFTTVCVGCTSVTDRRQTDGRATANGEREREFTFANNRESGVG